MRTRLEIPRTAFPLQWPPGVARSKVRESARFHGTARKSRDYVDASGVTRTSTWRVNTDLTVAAARDDVLGELQRLGARDPVVLSTNMRVRLDGLPASNQVAPADPGVAVYFMLDGHETCIAIDRFDRVADNLRAVAKTIEAMRGIERWGGASLVAAAFTGFQSLPGPGESSDESPWTMLGIDRTAPPEAARAAYRAMLAAAHPDKPGGDSELFIRRQAAWARCVAERPELRNGGSS